MATWLPSGLGPKGGPQALTPRGYDRGQQAAGRTL